MKEFDPEELGRFSGKDGAPVYISLEGKVYDVSGSELWETGTHMARHNAGRALDDEFGAAPHGLEVLERVPQVGILKKAPPRSGESARPGLLDRHPFFKRHPHPMTVHFPIAFMFATTVFTLLYLVTGEKSFDTTAFHCLGVGVLFNAVAVTTGFYTWWLNYMAKPLRPVKIKIPLTLLMLLTSAVLFSWRFNTPDILDAMSGLGLLYILLVLSLSAMVTVIGWFGASMTFPVERE